MDETHVYGSKYVCANHFVPSDFTTKEKKKLNHQVVPTVFDATKICFSPPKVTECKIRPSDMCQVTTLSPCSPHVLPVKRVYSRVHNEISDSVGDRVVPFGNDNDFMPSFSSTPKCPPKARLRLELTDSGSCSTSVGEHSETLAMNLSDGALGMLSPKFSHEKKLGCKLLNTFCVSRVSSLTPRKQKLFRQVQGVVKALKRVRRKLSKQKISFQDTIVSSKQLLANELKDLSPAAFHFLVSQLRCRIIYIRNSI